MDVNKADGIPPVGDAPKRQAGRQDHDQENERPEDEDARHARYRSWADDTAVELDGLLGDGLPPEAAQVLNALAAQIEPMRLEAEQAKAAEARYRELATTHPILNVPNRREFERELQHVIDHLDSMNPAAALLVVDVTSAGTLRGELGREAADQAMAHVVETISQVIHPTDTLGSLCGYDLGVILLNGDPENVALRTESIHQKMQTQLFMWQGTTHRLHVRSGAAILSAGQSTADAIQAADRVLRTHAPS